MDMALRDMTWWQHSGGKLNASTWVWTLIFQHSDSRIPFLHQREALQRTNSQKLSSLRWAQGTTDLSASNSSALQPPVTSMWGPGPHGDMVSSITPKLLLTAVFSHTFHTRLSTAIIAYLHYKQVTYSNSGGLDDNHQVYKQSRLPTSGQSSRIPCQEWERQGENSPLYFPWSFRTGIITVWVCFQSFWETCLQSQYRLSKVIVLNSLFLQ